MWANLEPRHLPHANQSITAIGYSTNLIAPDSNIIVVRGGEYGKENAVYTQLRDTVERFFPNENILDLDEVHPPEITTTENPTQSPKPGNLRRTATGLSEILDEENGNKPGGFILVIDGSALGHVCELSRFTVVYKTDPPFLGTRGRIHQAVVVADWTPLRGSHLLSCLSTSKGTTRSRDQR